MKIKRFKIFLQGAFFAVFVFSFYTTIFAQTVAPKISETDRIRLAEAFRLEERLAEKVWKNWRKTPLAVLLVTREHEFLIGHPAPSKDFTEIGYDKLLKSKIYYRKQQFNPAFLATFPAVGGVSTIVVGQAENTLVKASTLWVVTLLHEHFHQMQDSQPGFYKEVLSLGLANGDETGMWMLNYPFPYTDKTINEKFAELAKQLAKALETKNKKEFQIELDNYLKLRKEFNASLKPDDYKYLSFQFWKEGTATYTEYEIAKLAAKNYKPSAEFTKLKDYKTYAETADEILKRIINSLKNLNLEKSQREVVYPFGAGEAMLLDRAGIDWKQRYLKEKFYLDKYFDSAK